MRWIALIAACSLLLAGCLATNETPEDARDISVQAFAKGHTPEDVRPSIVEVPASEFQAPVATDTDTDLGTTQSGDTITQDARTLQSTNPDGTPVVIKDGTKTTNALPVGQKWPVDALIGQINGKPLYADDFLKSREDRIRRTVAEPDRKQAYAELLRLLDEAFDQFVNNELVISEAEGAIPDEAKEGLLSWMRDLQEKEIANRGGTRSEAQRSIEEEFPGTTIEEFMKRQKNEILASDLMRRRIRPRTIVSWRDIERLYTKNYDTYNPPPTLRVGRVAVLKTDAAKIEQVKALFASGKPFTEVAKELKVPNDGMWREIKLTGGGIDAVPDLVDDMKARLKTLKEGVVDGPVEQRSQVSWMTLLPSTQEPPRSIFDQKLQLQLRRQLENQRYGMEQYRYLQSIRTRWISEDLDQMKKRLIQFALERYWRSSMPER